jgi:hypothetical protein
LFFSFFPHQLTGIPTTEPGVVNFKVETLQCRVGLNLQHLQSLHIKVSPLPDHKDQWTAEEMQVNKILPLLISFVFMHLFMLFCAYMK